MSACSLALLAAMLVGFPRYGDWGHPRSTPAPIHALPGIGPSARDVGQLSKQVRTEIHTGRRSGRLSRDDAKALRRESRRIEYLRSRYAEDGLSESELIELRNRLEALHSITFAKTTGTADTTGH
ncbi:MAG TPA: hypothetical protein VFK19_01835 [Sphingomicrobium sp.]|nr:hypothetical protein [Sphingomicrobium sp.]